MGRNIFFQRLPLLFFLAIYLFTGYIGSMFILFGSDTFWNIYVYFSGVEMPDIYMKDLYNILLLLHLPPIVMWIGYEILLYFFNKKNINFNFNLIESNSTTGRMIVKCSFIIVILIAIFSIIRSESYQYLASWLDYNESIQARYNLFTTLNFFEFVNIYTIIPVVGALLILYCYNSPRKYQVIISVVLFMIFINIFIYQKKPLITGIIIISFSIILHYIFNNKDKFSFNKYLKYIVGCVVSVYILYVALVTLPIISENSQVYSPDEATVTVFKSSDDDEFESKEKIRNNKKQGNGDLKENFIFRTYSDSSTTVFSSRTESIVLYGLLAPISRTSVQNIVYPVVFPEEKDYYTIDFGQDILGFGQMPNDNVVIWNKIYPNYPGGSVAAPFHVILYSQGGLWISIILSLIIGIVLSFGWNLVLSDNGDNISPFSSVLGSLILLFSVYIGLDAFRNSITVSYGILWPMAFLCFIYFLMCFIDSLKKEKIIS